MSLDNVSRRVPVASLFGGSLDIHYISRKGPVTPSSSESTTGETTPHTTDSPTAAEPEVLAYASPDSVGLEQFWV